MTIIQYKLVPIDNNQKVIPLWVKDGGYFYESETEKMIGIANEEHLPEYIRVLTEEDLLTVVLEQHEQNPMQKLDIDQTVAEVMTAEEVALMVNDWLVIKRGEHE
jgi:hypothetical protein